MSATVRVTIPRPSERTRRGRTLAVLVTGTDRTRRDQAAIVGERVKLGASVELAPGALVLVCAEGHDGHALDLLRVERGELRRLDHGTLRGGPDAWLPVALDSIERAQAGEYDEPDRPPVVPLTVPPAPGRRGFTRERFTVAVVVGRVDRDRRGDGALIGERLRGRTSAPAGALLVVYGEDRAPHTGELRAHCADLWRVAAGGVLRPVESLRLAAEAGDDGQADWPAAMLDAIEAAARWQPRHPGRLRERVPIMLPPGARLSRRTGYVAALLAAVTLAGIAAGGTRPASADVRSGAAWSVRLAPGEWARLPASVCAGALPSDYEAWSTTTGERVGDRRLFHGTSPARIVGSSYRGPVLAYAWCEHGEHVTVRGGVVRGAVLGVHAHGRSRATRPERLPWPWPRIIARAQGRA